MEKENKAVELNGSGLDKVTGGYADHGQCEKGLEDPSLSVCPIAGCREYTPSHYMASGGPFCNYFCRSVR